MRKPLVPAGASLTFADYFEITADAEDVAAHFGYSFTAEPCTLPTKNLESDHIAVMKTRLEQDLPFVSLTNEVARREFLIAPVLFEAVHHAHARVRLEYPVEVNQQLKGTLDYFLTARNNILVVEAQQGDLQRGFNQLAVELIAVDQWIEEPDPETVWGAVSMGDVWRFGFLRRQEKHLTQDLNLYSVPQDLERLVGTLVAILTAERNLL